MLRDPVAQPIPVNRQTPAASPTAPDTAPAPLAESRLDDAVQSREELATLLPDNDALMARLKHLAQVATRTETANEPATAPVTSQATEAAATEAAKATEAAHAEASVTAPEATPVAEEAAAPAEMDAEPETQNEVQASPADDKPAKADAVAPEQEATASAEAAQRDRKSVV